jgi:hypothetical protein
MRPELIGSPAPGSAKAVTAGRQRSQLRYDLGKGVVMLAVIVFAVLLIADYITLAIAAGLGIAALGLWLAYSY